MLEDIGKIFKVQICGSLQKLQTAAFFYANFNKNLRNTANFDLSNSFNEIFIKICDNLQNYRFILCFLGLKFRSLANEIGKSISNVFFKLNF